MQPVIGVLADRSKSRWGRRRPFMLAGCAVSVFAMMLLAWAREVSGWFGGGNGLAIALAVWAIYLIDFVSSAFRLRRVCSMFSCQSPSMRFRRQIEHWWLTFFRHPSKNKEMLGQVECLGRGRSQVSMCEYRFLPPLAIHAWLKHTHIRGNINLLALFPILGKTQLQVLSFLTSVTLMATHGLTAYSVKERVLLRDKQVGSLPRRIFANRLMAVGNHHKAT